MATAPRPPKTVRLWKGRKGLQIREGNAEEVSDKVSDKGLGCGCFGTSGPCGGHIRLVEEAKGNR